MRAMFWVAVAAMISAAPAALAQDKGPTLRPEVGKPIQAALELLKSKRGKEALAKAREAQSIGDKTAYETLVVDQVIGQTAAAAGEHAVAARALESAGGSSAANDSQKRQFLAAAAGQYYAVKEYAKAADLAGRASRDGGGDKALRTLYVQSLYLSNNFAAAAKAASADVEADEQAGRAPTETQLQLLLDCYTKQRDAAGQAKAMEKLLAYYPKKDYWASVLHAVVTRQGFNERLAIDVARLRLDIGLMRTASDYVEAAQLSLQDGVPFEATKIIEQGYTAGLLGSGPDAERHRRLKDLAAKNLAEDRKAMSQEDPAGGKDGKALFNEGFNYVLYGKADKGLPMMEQGLKLGTGFRRPEHARLQLAYAYHLAGQKAKAIQNYKSVKGDDGAANIARLWTIKLNQGG